MADAQASGACGSNIVWVQVPSPALLERMGCCLCSDLFLFYINEEVEKKFYIEFCKKIKEMTKKRRIYQIEDKFQR